MTSPTPIPDSYLAELATLTGMSPGDWRDFLSCTPEEQAAIAQAYRDQDWFRHPDTFGKVMGVLVTVGTIAGVVAGVATAATVLKAL